MSTTISGGLYPNQVVANKINDILDTKLDVRGLFTVDNSLTTNAGLVKRICKYTYSNTGGVEQLARGAANTNFGSHTLVYDDYTVQRYQQTYKYNEQDVMVDPMVPQVYAEGAAQVMVNHIRAQFFSELANISNTATVSSGDSLYEGIVDAIADLHHAGDMDIEGLFLIMGADARAEIRKDRLFEASKQGEILYTGQFGTVAGIPCVFSNSVPSGKIYLTEKAAITFFVKKEGTVEQDKNIQTKEIVTVYERYGVVALTDDRRSCIISF